MGPAFMRKYGVGTGADIYVPIVKRAVVDLAVSADWTPVAGDVKISQDGGAAANIGTLPTAVTMGNTAYWLFVFTNAELQCKKAVISVGDAATKAVEDQMFLIETFGDPSALYQADFSAANLPANALAINNSTSAAVNQALAANSISVGVVGTGSTTTSIVTSSLTPGVTVTDQLKGRIVIFGPATTTAALRNQTTDITGSSTGGVLTASALTTAPVSSDTFIIV